MQIRLRKQYNQANKLYSKLMMAHQVARQTQMLLHLVTLLIPIEAYTDIHVHAIIPTRLIEAPNTNNANRT